MLDQGNAQKDIAETLGVDKGYVSRIKSQAIKDGHLTKDGKLTQSGFILTHGA
jgi:DNA-directed RNA polymerase specialized sigma subunit